MIDKISLKCSLVRNGARALAHTHFFPNSLFIFNRQKREENRNTEQCAIKCGIKMAQRVPFMMAHLLSYTYKSMRKLLLFSFLISTTK